MIRYEGRIVGRIWEPGVGPCYAHHTFEVPHRLTREALATRCRLELGGDYQELLGYRLREVSREKVRTPVPKRKRVQVPGDKTVLVEEWRESFVYQDRIVTYLVNPRDAETADLLGESDQ